jgi:hypothetical protein
MARKKVKIDNTKLVGIVSDNEYGVTRDAE